MSFSLLSGQIWKLFLYSCLWTQPQVQARWMLLWLLEQTGGVLLSWFVPYKAQTMCKKLHSSLQGWQWGELPTIQSHFSQALLRARAEKRDSNAKNYSYSSSISNEQGLISSFLVPAIFQAQKRWRLRQRWCPQHINTPHPRALTSRVHTWGIDVWDGSCMVISTGWGCLCQQGRICVGRAGPSPAAWLHVPSAAHSCLSPEGARDFFLFYFFCLCDNAKWGIIPPYMAMCL